MYVCVYVVCVYRVAPPYVLRIYVPKAPEAVKNEQFWTPYVFEHL